MDLKDELNELTENELRILLDGFESQFWETLLLRYRMLREVRLNRQLRAMNPSNGELAMRAIGELQGKNLELAFLFDQLPKLCKDNLDKRIKDENSEPATQDINTAKYTNPLAGI